MMYLLPQVLLISLLQILPSASQPLDFPQRKSCDLEDIRQRAIRQVRSAGEKLHDLQKLYDKTMKTNNYLQTQNSKLLEGFKNASNDSRLFDLYMNALNESVLQEELLNEIESQKDLLDLQVKTLESEKDQLLSEFNDVRNFLTETSDNEGFLHVSDAHMFFIPSLEKNWTESEKYCRLLNGFLANILDDKMNTNMKNSVRRLTPEADYWIGGIRQENGWIWTGNNSTREPILWFDWAPGANPNSTGGYCMHMWKVRDFQWDNDWCQNEKRFICAKPLF